MWDKIFGAIFPAVTKRASIFSPMLNLNIVVGLISLAVYWHSDNLAVFIPWLLILIFSLRRHEKWADDPQTRPLLAPQKVAIKWLDLTLGDKRNIIEGEAIAQQKTGPGVPNPEAKNLKEGNRK